MLVYFFEIPQFIIIIFYHKYIFLNNRKLIFYSNSMYTVLFYVNNCKMRL